MVSPVATVPTTLPTSAVGASGTADALWTELQRLGVVCYRSGTTLRASAPTGTLTPELRAAIAHHRDALVARLTPHACTTCGRFAFAAPTVCFWCRP